MAKKLKKYQTEGIVRDNTAVYKPTYKSPEQIDAEEKVKIAEKLYKDNPSKVFRDALDSAKVKLSRITKKD